MSNKDAIQLNKAPSVLSRRKSGPAVIDALRSRSFSNAAQVRKDSFMLKNMNAEDDDLLLEDIIHENNVKSVDMVTFASEMSSVYMRSNTARIIVFAAAIFSCVIYVFETYLRHDNVKSFNVIMVVSDIVIFGIFLLDYVCSLIFAVNKTLYIFSISGIVDFASLFAVTNLFITTDLRFLPLFRLMRVIKIIRLFRTASIMNVERPAPPSASEAIAFEILSLVVGIVVSIFLASAILFTLTQEFEDSFINGYDSEFSMKDDITFFDCVYIVLVILSTLGFGDFIPNNALGRFYVVAVLAIALTVIPTRVGQLIEIVGKKPRYMNDYVIGSNSKPHIVIYANLNQENFQRLVLLILSQGTNDPELVEDSQPLALMSPVFPSPQLQLLLQHPINARKVQFFVGTVKSSSDLRRVKACSALAVFIFADSDLTEMIDTVEEDDYSTKLKAVSVINHLNEELGGRGREVKRPIVISQAYTHDVCFSLLVYGVDRIISLINMKYSLLAFTALYPGFLAIVNNLTIPSNLSSSSSSVSQEELKNNEYDWGECFELIEIPIKTNTSEGVKKLTFSLCCRFLYEWSKGTCIPVGIYDHVGCNMVVLNPLRNAIIGDCGSLFVITNNLEVTLALLNMKNPKRVWRRQKSTSNVTVKDKRSSTIGAQAEAFWKDVYQDPSAATTTFETYGLRREPSSDFDPKMLQFSRHESCFRKKKRCRLNSLTSEPSSSPTRRRQGSIDDIATAGGFQCKRSFDTLTSSSFGVRPQSSLGSDLNRVPTSSIRIGENGGEYMFSKNYKDHVVLVCAYSPSHSIPRISSAIITFVKAFRVKSDETIVVLVLKAIEIESFCRHRSKVQHEKFDDNLIFVHGVPNTIRGLQSVDVCHARCICIIGAETAAAKVKKKSDIEISYIEAKQDSEEVNTDLYIVLAALELDAILSLYIRRLLRENRQAPLPIVIQEISSDSTINFLPEYYRLSRKAKRLWEKHDKQIWECRRGMSVEDVDIGFQRNINSQSQSQSQSAPQSADSGFEPPSPALSQGRVLTKHVMDGLTIKMLYNPHILEFWQVLSVLFFFLCITVLICTVTVKTVMGMEKRNYYSTKEQQENMLKQGTFDKLEVPANFKGTFKDLFEVLLVTFGAIAVGLNRFPENGSPYVVVLPPQEAKVAAPDQVFVILTHFDSDASKSGDAMENQNLDITQDDIVLNLEQDNDVAEPASNNDEEQDPQWRVSESVQRHKNATLSAFTS